MSISRISEALRRLVQQRAGMICEYCLLHADDLVHRLQIDHVISEKHGGPTADHNLALCCPFCNRAKGSDIAGLLENRSVRLFNPRIDVWREHFRLDGIRLTGLTEIGQVTASLLQMNDAHRLALRAELLAAGLFPCESARLLF